MLVWTSFDAVPMMYRQYLPASFNVPCMSAVQVQVAQQALELDGLPTTAVVDGLKQALAQAETDRKADALKHKNILTALKRKLKVQEDSIQTLTRAVKDETGKNDQLRGQLAGALEEQMDSEVGGAYQSM